MGHSSPRSSQDQHTPFVSVGYPLGGMFSLVSVGFLDAGGLTGIMMSQHALKKLGCVWNLTNSRSPPFAHLRHLSRPGISGSP